jgi:hypothetical protein
VAVGIMKKAPSTMRYTRGLVAANACLWLLFAAVTAAGLHPSYVPGTVVWWVMTGLAVVTAGVLATLAWLLRRNDPLAFWLTTATLTAIILFGLMDDLGLSDLVFLLITSLPLALILKDRSWYLGHDARAREGGA